MEQLMGPGFALRNNGSCASNLVNCGPTADPYYACCPLKAPSCPHSYNVDCCETEKNCTTTILKNPQCANQTWDLYDNGGYFCCEKGFTGYAHDSGSDGCAAPGYKWQAGETLLSPVSIGQVATSTSTSTTSTTSPSSRPTNTTQSSGSSTNTGAIAGGVVGGCLVVVIGLTLAWFFLWRKRKQKKVEGDGFLGTPSSGMAAWDASLKTPVAPQHELPTNGYSRHELEARSPAAQLAERNEYSELAS